MLKTANKMKIFADSDEVTEEEYDDDNDTDDN